MSIMEEEDGHLADMFASSYGSVRILLVEEKKNSLKTGAVSFIFSFSTLHRLYLPNTVNAKEIIIE